MQGIKVIKLTNHFFILFAFLLPFHLEAKVIYSWSQVIPNNMISVRAIVDNRDCPIACVDGEEIPMNERVSPVEKKFAEKVCELSLPRETKEIIIDDHQIPTLSVQIKKIAFIGDTGCRVTNLVEQACDSTKEWPLTLILNSISDHNPDLIVHVGDYHYREKTCKSGQKCNQVYNYGSDAWYSDWFDPARNISELSPFLFLRGNHEGCSRAYEGWFRYFDPSDFSSAKCSDHIPSWVFDVGPMQLDVFDSSYGKDSDYTEEQIKTFNEQFDFLLQNNNSKPAWFLTHRPLWSHAKKSAIFYHDGNIAQVKAFGNRFSANISAIISGHVHIAQIIFMKEKPTQVMVGNGGSLLYSQNQKPVLYGVDLEDAKAQEIRTLHGFGFAILDLDEHKISFYDENNNETYFANLTEDFCFKS